MQRNVNVISSFNMETVVEIGTSAFLMHVYFIKATFIIRTLLYSMMHDEYLHLPCLPPEVIITLNDIYEMPFGKTRRRIKFFMFAISLPWEWLYSHTIICHYFSNIGMKIRFLVYRQKNLKTKFKEVSILNSVSNAMVRDLLCLHFHTKINRRSNICFYFFRYKQKQCLFYGGSYFTEPFNYNVFKAVCK